MKINVEKVKKLVGEAKRGISTLKGFSALEKEELLQDPGKLERIKYNFIVAIQSAIDLCNHLVAKKGDRAPEDYSDCFKILDEMGVIDHSLSRNLSQMAKFRNLLVHLYWEVDDEKVCDILKERVIDLDRFLENIAKILKDQNGDT